MRCWEVVSEFRWINNQIVKIAYRRLGKLKIKNESELSFTMFLAKVVSLDQYDEELGEIFIVDDEQLQFDNMQDGL